MSWSVWLNAVALGFLFAGILLLISGLFRKYVSTFGLALVIGGFLFDLLAAFIG
jgi:hypothetical protein